VKRNAFFICLLAWGTCAATATGQTIIAQWNFNTETLGPSTGAGTATALGNVTDTFAAGSTPDQGGTSNRAWSIAGFPAQGTGPRTAGVQFAVDTSGYENLLVSWDHRFSATASRRAVLQVSTEGERFVDAFALDAPGEGWTNSVCVDLRQESALANNPLFAFRIVSDFDPDNEYTAAKPGSAYSTAGTWRFDRVTLIGTPVGMPAEPPVILTQPLNLTVPVGAQAVLAVGVSGTEPLRYQWWLGEAAIVGATNQVLEFPSASKTDEGIYRVAVSNWVGAATSDPAVLRVMWPPLVQFTNVLKSVVRPGDALTNSYYESVLYPGESLTSAVAVSDPEGGLVTVEPDTNDTPDGLVWDFRDRVGSSVGGAFEFTASETDAGRPCTVRLWAWNEGVTNATVWNIYVATSAEQRVVLTEYLANPSSTPDSPFFNPLRRETPASNPTQHDEYIELVNTSDADIDLQGWTVSDASEVRHRFSETFVLPTRSAVVVYGGPATDNPPALDVPGWPANATSAGLSLNNSGDSILVRNAVGHFVLRVVYTSKMVARDGSMTRYPSADSPFVSHASVAPVPVSPGLSPDGHPWDELDPVPSHIEGLEIHAEPGGALRLSWKGHDDPSYTIWMADHVEGPYTPLVSGWQGTEYDGLTSAEGVTRFYRVSQP